MIRSGRDPSGRHYVEVGPGVRLFTDDYYMEVFGCSQREFRELCKQLNVPIANWFGRRYVWYEAFLKAIAFRLNVGKPPMYGPSSSVNAPRTVTDPDEFAASESAVVNALMTGMKASSLTPTHQLETELRRNYKMLAAQQAAMARENGRTNEPTSA